MAASDPLLPAERQRRTTHLTGARSTPHDHVRRLSASTQPLMAMVAATRARRRPARFGLKPTEPTEGGTDEVPGVFVG
jgi:hypothetical protein